MDPANISMLRLLLRSWRDSMIRCMTLKVGLNMSVPSMFTIYHIWIECTVAEAVWQEMKEIWEFLSTIKSRIPVSIDEFIAFMALCPVHAAAQSGGRRWEITYQTAVWTIWKAYLSHFFDQSHNYWISEVSLRLYRELIKSRVLTDRTVSMRKTLQIK